MQRENELLMDSPYTYLDNIPLITPEPPVFETDIKKMFRDGEYGRIEYLLLEALHIFRYLNKFNITRYLDIKLKDKKWKDYSRIIKKLLTDEVISFYQYGNHRFYTLHPYARNYMDEKVKKSKILTEHTTEHTKEEVLQTASLAQWHIALMQDKTSYKSYFLTKMSFRDENHNVDSYVAIKKGQYRYHVLSHVLPKTDKDIVSFLEKICSISSVLSEQNGRKRDITLTVVVVSNLKEIKAISKLVASVRIIKDKTIYFVLEGNSAEFSGLTCLYYLDRDSENTEDSIRTITIGG